MSLSDHHVFHWFTTPERLRDLANKMEVHWKTCAPGQDATVSIEWGKSAELRILVDQDLIKSPGWMNRAAQHREEPRG